MKYILEYKKFLNILPYKKIKIDFGDNTKIYDIEVNDDNNIILFLSDISSYSDIYNIISLNFVNKDTLSKEDLEELNLKEAFTYSNYNNLFSTLFKIIADNINKGDELDAIYIEPIKTRVNIYSKLLNDKLEELNNIAKKSFALFQNKEDKSFIIYDKDKVDINILMNNLKKLKIFNKINIK